ncbi:bifunctional metallophosphatase/5'-nucleotidase [uncultured Flavonifractor sp.]|uniref:bifunctional metallophosphatase/5'-nucleotidase n=1 Tax=uncultured Flavonifractor sp. TaxID=1193534 RepID=UPI0026308848|nr:bifunctional UDP-sugar hydrolase/5'-nucleotidase [uncultured Flavonifractor sp.]
MKKHTRKVLSLLLTLSMAGSLCVPAMAADETSGEGAANDVVVLHTNDVHGAIGSYAKVAALKAQYEAEGTDVILVDAGDFIQGDPTVSISQGANAVELMNMVGYDLAVPGNHEFDYGYENLKTLSESAEFPILAANVTSNGSAAFADSYVLETDSGTKVGFVGVTTPETATKAHPAKIAGLTFDAGDKMFADVQASVDKLEADGCDYIVCVGHLGIDEESTGNRSVDLLAKVDGIDVFIDGHSHSTQEDILAVTDGTGKVGDTVLTSTGTELENIGVVTLSDGSASAESVKVADLTAEDEAIAARAAEITAQVEADYGTVFAKTEVLLNGDKDPGNRTQETNLGDLITDALMWGAAREGETIDAAVTNGGGIRAPIQVGDVTKKDVNTVLPFGNTLSIVKVTGAELLEVLEASTYCTPAAVGGFPQVSGIIFTVDTTKPYDQGEAYPKTTYYAPASIQRVTIESVGGKPFDPNAVYTIATNDFMAAGGDTYYAFKTASANYDLGLPMDEVLMDYITDELGGVITADQYGQPDGRITILTAAATENATRGDVYQALYELAGKPAGADKATFADVEGKDYADAAAWAEDNGLTNGNGNGLFEGDRAITRAELATALGRYASLTGVTVEEGGMSMQEAADYDQIPAWALEGMSFCYYGQLMTADSNGALNPGGTVLTTELDQILTAFGALNVAEAA